MTVFASFSIPAKEAVRIVDRHEPLAKRDIGYIGKTTIGEVFGRDAIRPFRPMPVDGENLRFMGIVDSARGQVRINDRMADRVSYRAIPFEIRVGTVVEIDVMASPQKQVPGTVRRRRVDAFDGVGAREDVYAVWLTDRLSRPDLGATLVDGPTVISATTTRTMRKHSPGVWWPVVQPLVRATVVVRVENPIAFDSLMRRGIGCGSGFGISSIIPQEVLDAQ